jgi:hypothetical protein
MENLQLTNGCPVSTLEALWKYARPDANILRRVSSFAKKDYEALVNRAQEELLSARQDHYSYHDLGNMIKDKLSTQSLRSFADCVDSKYHNAFREHYCTFQYTPADILQPTDINRLYDQMKHDFPITHSVISTIVSNTKTIIEVNKIFNNGVMEFHELSDDDDDTAPHLHEPDNNDPNSRESDDEDDAEAQG